MKDEPPLKLVWGLLSILLLVFVLQVPIHYFAQKEPLIPLSSPITTVLAVNNSALIAVSSPEYIRPRIFGSLIDCLIKYESAGKEDAVGDHGKAINVLQFWESTFNHYKERYNMEWLIYDDKESQIILAETMLEEDINLITHWTTYPLCYPQ